MITKPDRIYATEQSVAPFSFDEQVAEVFPDMIQRSVPGYATMIDAIGQVAARFAQAGSRLYDLGCSLGAATLAMRRSVTASDCRIIAVDNSPAMTQRARRHIEAFRGVVPVEVQCADICELPIEDASVVVLNFTLQFVAADQRQALLSRIADGMRPGGVLVLSEKLAFEQPAIQDLLVGLHHNFKRTNGYSELEISQKRQALENVLVPDTRACHEQRLRHAGFSQVETWYQCYNFASLIALR